MGQRACIFLALTGPAKLLFREAIPPHIHTNSTLSFSLFCTFFLVNMVTQIEAFYVNKHVTFTFYVVTSCNHLIAEKNEPLLLPHIPPLYIVHCTLSLQALDSPGRSLSILTEKLFIYFRKQWPLALHCIFESLNTHVISCRGIEVKQWWYRTGVGEWGTHLRGPPKTQQLR